MMEPMLFRMVSLPLLSAEIRDMLEETGVRSAATITAAKDAHEFASLIGRLLKNRADRDPGVAHMAERCAESSDELKQLWE